jgi:hypothetical protein
MADGDGNLHRQVGEILGALRGLTTQLQEFKRDSERREDRLTEEISEVRELRKKLVRYGLLMASVIGIVWSILSGPVSGAVSKLIGKMLGNQ